MNKEQINIHLAADIGEELVELQIGKHMTWEDREDGSEGFTDEAQDIFNDIYDIILTQLNKRYHD